MPMKTTVRQIYEASCRAIYETPGDDEDLKNSFPFHLQLALLHALDTENVIRAAGGRQVLHTDDIPDIREIGEQTLPFDERILRLAVPYCIKSKFLEDDNSKKAESVIEWNRFVDALAGLAPGAVEDVPQW